MLVSLNWVKEYVELPTISNRQITDLITIRTAEIDAVHQVGAHLDTVVVAEVLNVEKLPSGKVSKVLIRIAPDRTETVVCGAANVCPGMKTAFAPVGCVLPGGTIVAARELQGVISNGFLCSESELGLSDDMAGIITLDASAEIGHSLSVLFPDAVDTVVEIDNKSLTHRPDLWCHYGFARELATIFDHPLKDPFTAQWREKILSAATRDPAPVTPDIDPASSCLGYLCVSIDHVRVEVSPSWMKHRLHRVGIRSVNSIVDIGNYVMLELGLPIHFFDGEQIVSDRIKIQRLSQAVDLELLDGSTAKLVAGDTVICDARGPLIVAGIMGGANSGVVSSTGKLLLEVANWKPAEVRRTSLRLGIRTESSLRYEKSLDSQLIERTALRALELVEKSSPSARIIGPFSRAMIPVKAEDVVIKLSLDYVRRILGAPVPESEVSRILSGLGFENSKNGDEYTVRIPSYRATKDVSCDMDLIEEIGRMWGYEKIAPTSPQFQVKPVRLPVMKKVQRTLSDLMVFRGRAHEIMTYPLIGEDLLKRMGWDDSNEKLMLKNPWSTEFDRMRPSVVPSALNSLTLNQKNFNSFRSFEFGRSYSAAGDFCVEREDLVFTLFDRGDRNFISAVELVENILSVAHRSDARLAPLSQDADIFVAPSWIGLIPGMCYEIRAGDAVIGAVFEVSPQLLRSLKVRGNVSIGVIGVQPLAESSAFDPRVFEGINVFPATWLDLTIVAGSRIPVGDILDLVKRERLANLAQVKIASVFELQNSQKAVTLRITLQKSDGTLNSDELKECELHVVETLNKAGYPLR